MQTNKLWVQKEFVWKVSWMFCEKVNEGKSLETVE